MKILSPVGSIHGGSSYLTKRSYQLPLSGKFVAPSLKETVNGPLLKKEDHKPAGIWPITLTWCMFELFLMGKFSCCLHAFYDLLLSFGIIYRWGRSLQQIKNVKLIKKADNIRYLANNKS